MIEDETADAADREGRVEEAPLATSLYVHAPFCVSKCAYCDFYSEAGASDTMRARFIEAALFELGHWSHYDLLDDVVTVYIGGGTPTLLGEHLPRLVRGIRETARIRSDAEFTVETNPETTGETAIARLVDEGVNRFSLGVQSYDDEVLATLGRCHDASRAADAATVLEHAGVPYSVDLICGVPGQTFESWEATLERAVACGARHVSVYPLSVEEGTPLAAAVADGDMPAPDPDAAADMMLAAEVALTAAGMPRYEVASYAQPGFESRHNIGYWTGRPYVGVGPRAASMLPAEQWGRVASGEGWRADVELADRGAARARFTRDADLRAYLRDPLAHPGAVEYMTREEAAREDVMLGMRLARGVESAAVEAAGVAGVFARLVADGLVELVDAEDGEPRYRTTQRGWLLGNRVFADIWDARG